MNNDRRKRLNKALELLAEARELISECAAEERDAYDNLPENMQNAERGERMGEAADNLENAESEIESVEGSVQEAIDQ